MTDRLPSDEEVDVQTDVRTERPRAEPFDAHRLFVERYATIRTELALHPHHGVLVLAFDQRAEPIGSCWRPASIEAPAAMIVGRHSACSLRITGSHPTVALRHLAIVVEAESFTRSRVRVIDLRTNTGFSDESGNMLESASIDGPAFLAIERVHLVILPTHADQVLYGDPEEAYARVPPRVFIDQRTRAPGSFELGKCCLTTGSHRRPATADDEVSITRVEQHEGPLSLSGALCGDLNDAAGELIVRTREEQLTIAVGRRELTRGILAGRYSRCDLRCQTDREDGSTLSRVHVLLTELGGELVVVDAASTNGTWQADRELFVERIGAGAIRLGTCGTMSIEWCPARKLM